MKNITHAVFEGLDGCLTQKTDPTIPTIKNGKFDITL